MAFEVSPLCLSDPRADDNFVVEERRPSVLDLVPRDDPQQRFLVVGRCRMLPVRHGSVLHPFQVDHVVHVTQLVYVRRLHTDSDLEPVLRIHVLRHRGFVIRGNSTHSTHFLCE